MIKNQKGFIQHHLAIFIKKSYLFKNGAGFTLIELLVVIAIIGILSTLLTANFIGVRQRSRDAQRKSNLRQIQSALELYRADNASYPLDSSRPFSTCQASFGAGSATYMKQVPCDPSGPSYTYTSSGSTYTLVACLENTKDSDPQTKTTNPDIPCNTTTGVSYTLTNP